MFIIKSLSRSTSAAAAGPAALNLTAHKPHLCLLRPLVPSNARCNVAREQAPQIIIYMLPPSLRSPEQRVPKLIRSQGLWPTHGNMKHFYFITIAMIEID
jgi:hypothetical protein